MELTSTCVVEHQNKAARWDHLAWEQKRMIAPGFGGNSIGGGGGSSFSCSITTEMVVGGVAVVGGAGVAGVAVSAIGCCCLICCISYCVKSCVKSNRNNPVNVQQLAEIEIDPVGQAGQAAREAVPEIEISAEQKVALFILAQPDAQVQVQVVSADKNTTNSADQTKSPTVVQVASAGQTIPPTEQNPHKNSLDGSATWVESPTDTGQTSPTNNVYN